MPCTFEEAYSVITTKVNEIWPVVSEAITGFPVEMRYAGIEAVDDDGKVKQIPQTHFARFTLQRVVEEEITIRNGELGRRYEHAGLIIIQIFTDRQEVRCQEFGRRLADAARDIFRGQTFDGGIAFRRCRVNDLDPESKFQRFNVIVEYEFDEIA